MKRFISIIIFQVLLCRCSLPVLTSNDIGNVTTRVDQETVRIISEWKSRQKENISFSFHEYPETTPTEIQRDIANGAKYVIERIKDKNPIFILLSEVEFSQLHDNIIQIDKDHVKIVHPLHPLFHLPFETYDSNPIRPPTKYYERIGREIALRWFYSRNIFPINAVSD